MFDIGLCAVCAVTLCILHIFRAKQSQGAEGSHPSIRHSEKEVETGGIEWVGWVVKITRMVRVTPSVTNLTMFQVGS
jgi:hypothetical protein